MKIIFNHEGHEGHEYWVGWQPGISLSNHVPNLDALRGFVLRGLRCKAEVQGGFRIQGPAIRSKCTNIGMKTLRVLRGSVLYDLRFFVVPFLGLRIGL